MNAILSTGTDPVIHRALFHDGLPPANRQSTSSSGVPPMLGRLFAADTCKARHLAVADMLAEVGCDWLAFGLLSQSSQGVRPVSMHTEFADHEWMRRYCIEKHFDVDPTLSDAMRSSLPVTWTLAELEARAASAAVPTLALRFVADLAATGMRGGAILALPADQFGQRNFISLLARAPDPRLLSGEMVGQVLTLGFCLHEYYTHQRTWAEPVDCASALTRVQLEILRHVTGGKSDKFIARELCISSFAVDYQMRQLRKRFAVGNRVQLSQASRAFRALDERDA